MQRTLYFILAAGAALVIPIAARAQGLDIKAGYSWGQVPNNGGALPGRLSAHSGAAVGVGVTSGGTLGWGIEGMYAERGFNSTTAGSSQRLSYVDVPVTLRVAAHNPALTPYAYAGPQASFELNCDGGGGACPSGRDRITYAGVIGGGVKFGRFAGLSAEGRYVYGLSDLHLSTVTSSANYKTRSFVILLGFGL